MKSVAVIGTGIAGMAAGYFLRRDYDVFFYEKQPRPGGHTNTVSVRENGREIGIDTGFIVFNFHTYPNLKRFFEELKIPIAPSSMSFSVQHLPLGLEYCGTGYSGLFAQRRNLFNFRFLKLLGQIDRFNRQCLEVLEDEQYAHYSLARYAEKKGLGQDFLDHYLIPMSSAVWSTPPDLMLRFPAQSLVRFFKNHGLLGGVRGHLQWYTVKGGSRVYRDKVLGLFPEKVFLASEAREVFRKNQQTAVVDEKGQKRFFDYVILASHADESLALLKDAGSRERELLGKFKYQKNLAQLHTDESVMPKKKRAWSSWNYRIQSAPDGRLLPSTVYYMNSLQPLETKRNYFVSINDPGRIAPEKILWQTEYEHPVFDLEAVRAQDSLAELNQNGRIFFCGSYFKYGFHEDAFTSGLEAARALAGRELWP